MNHKKQFFSILLTFLALHYGTAFGDGYKPPFASIDFTTQQTSTNTTLTTQAHSAKNQHKSPVPTPDQMAIVMGWMKNFYPQCTSQKTPVPQQPQTCKSQQASCMPKTISAPPAHIPQPKYNSIHIAALENQLSTYQHCAEWDTHADSIEQRNNAIKQLKNGNQIDSTQRYTLSEKMHLYCGAHSIAIDALELCEGDILQQTIHSEFVAITKKSADIWHTNKSPKAFKKATSIIADFTNAGVTFNRTDNTQKAVILANACWMILDCICAVGEGLIQGAHNTVDDIMHPVRTAKNMIDGVVTCGYYIGIVAMEVGELGYLAITPASPTKPWQSRNKTYKKLHTWADNFATMYDAIKEKISPLKTRDIIKESVAFSTQCYATSKVLHGIGTLFKHAHKHAMKIANNISQSSKAIALTTPEGIIVRIADNTVESMKNALETVAHTYPKAANMSEFFELPFGQIVKSKCIKTKKLYKKIIPIYEITEDIPGTTLKKGNLFYLDRMHKDHLEVFHGTKHTSQSVYNLNGTLNELKSKAASNRSIKQYL